MHIKNRYDRPTAIPAQFRWGLAAIFVALSTASLAETAPTEGRPALPASLRQKVQNFQSQLAAKNYEVAEGEFHLFTIDDCKYAIKSIGNCLGNNPAAPYVIPSVPLWNDEYQDPNMKDLLGPVGDKDGWTHRMADNEAIVILGLLPPPGRYFGVQPHIFTRETSLNFTDPIYQTLTDSFMKGVLFMSSPNRDRPLVFASVGDSINHVVITRQSGSAFDQQRFFIITSDEQMTADLSAALLRAGVPDSRQIFSAPIPPSIARLGLSSGADDFLTVIRYALPDDETAGEQWRRQLPLAVLRVRAKGPVLHAKPYALPDRAVRTARSELGLRGDVDDLVAAVKQKWGQTDAPDSTFYSLLQTVDLVGEHCLGRPMNCLGDSSDADYQISSTLALDSGEIAAVVGTLGTATGNAVYSSLSVNRLPELVGSSNVTDVQMQGSATGFADKVDNTDKLYVRYFARDCRNIPSCHQVTDEMVPRGGTLKLVQRNYVVPGSTRGPAPAQVVNPRLIVLKQPAVR